MTHEHQPDNEAGDARDNGPEQPGSPERSSGLSPRIWVGSLADYNNGDLHGQWMDADREPAAIHADIQSMLARGPAARRGEAPEEWGIFDYDEFGGLQLGEYELIEDVSRLAMLVVRYGEPFAVWANTLSPTDATAENFEESYLGKFESPGAYAAELVVDLGDGPPLESVPDWLRPYATIDYAALGHDLILSGEIFILDDSHGQSHFYRTI